MPYSDIYLYSPLTIKTVKEGQNRAILLQFILSELFHAMESGKKDDPLAFVFSSPACFFPVDWSYELGCLNKIADHARLLCYGFGKLTTSIHLFQEALEGALANVVSKKKRHEEMCPSELLPFLQKLYTLLQPFLIACSESEPLLVFLLKHPEEIARLGAPENLGSLLSRMYPEGLEKVSPVIQREYRSRNATAIMPELDNILTQYV